MRWSELDEDLMLRKLPGVFVAGEMIDWEAPTGGYLLQGCFATGTRAGRAAAAGCDRALPASARRLPPEIPLKANGLILREAIQGVGRR